jgi:hypothetical protein
VAEVDELVMSFVERVLDEDPEIELEELFERAKKSSSSVADLSKRQFNARYPLQVKRRRSQARRAREGAGKKRGARTARPPARGADKPAASREAVRQVFLEFATDITGAEERKELVRVLANVDRYVDQAIKGAARR